MQNRKIGQQVFNIINSKASLVPCPERQALRTLCTLEGSLAGGIDIFAGEKIEKMTIAEIRLAPEMNYTCILIKPTIQYNIPRFGLNFMVMSENIQFDIDLYPPVDLVLYPEYLDKYYEVLKNMYLSEKKAHYFDWRLSEYSWMRAMSSPYYFMSGTAKKNEDKVHALIYAYAAAWLKIWQKEEPVSAEISQQIKQRRDVATKTLQEREPERHMLENIFGKDLTDQISMAMV